MLNIIKKEKGNVLVMVALSLVVFFGFAALGIDVGTIMTARNQLQCAVDAAALGGASGLTDSQGEATNRAITIAALNDCINEPVVLTVGDVTFPTAEQIRVQTTRQVDLYFARFFGQNTADVTAVAVAELDALAGTGDVKPWAIPDLDYVYGEEVLLKAGELGAPGTNPGFFYPVDFPPLNRGTPVTGAQEYLTNLINGSADPIYIGDVLQVEPGNMVGPTNQGVDELIAMDPNATWGASGIENSAYANFSSPRIIKIPFYDPDYTPDSGRNTVEIVRLGAFFLEGMQGRNVYGRFIEITTAGDQNGGPSMLLEVKLAQ